MPVPPQCRDIISRKDHFDEDFLLAEGAIERRRGGSRLAAKQKACNQEEREEEGEKRRSREEEKKEGLLAPRSHVP